MKFLKFLKRKFVYIIIALIMLQIFYLFIMANSAAWLFNRAMEEQRMLIGTVTVEKIYANISGKTDFEGLKWQNLRGETILYVPEGTIGVKPFDIIQGKFETDSLYRIRLKNAKITLGLDENMQPDFIAKRKDNDEKHKDKISDHILAGETEEERIRRSEKWRQIQEDQLKNRIKNFNSQGRTFDIEFLLEDCPVEIFHNGKHYVLNSVNVESTIKSGKSLKYKLRTGQFSGSMTGGSVNLHGSIDLSGDEPTVDASALFQNINPESLGLINNLNDYMTLEVYFSGPLVNPKGTGTIFMDQLTMPNLPFENVRGKFTYEKGIFKFSELTAKIWDGELNLTGDYNLDTRYYHINGTATKLSAQKALPKESLSTVINANLHLVANENSRNMAIWGDFTTGSGFYKEIPFDSVSATFTNAYHDLRFYDAKIDIGYYRVTSDFIGVKEGKLTLDPVLLTNMETGKLRAKYVREN